MLYQELPSIESTPLGGWSRWLVPALIVGAALTAAILILLWGLALIAGAVLAAGAVAALVVYCVLRPSGRQAKRWWSAPIMRFSDRR